MNLILLHATIIKKMEKMLPDDWKDKIGKHNAIYFGAVGDPAKVPDHISLWGSLLKFRREFDQYINLRPVKLFEGVPCPLSNKKPGDIDMLIVRENTEGEYSSVGGRMYKNSDREIAVQETIMSRHGVDRVQKYAFELAKSKRRRKKLLMLLNQTVFQLQCLFGMRDLIKLKKIILKLKLINFI